MSPYRKLLENTPRDTALKAFQYQDLDYSSNVFRLLIIHPAQSYDHDIECHLFHASLDDQIDYSALSYCWGKDQKTSEIILNGKIFFITPNLEVALRDLRHYGRDGATAISSVWIDAICINQDNNAERSHQVGYMDSIYSCAERTIVWFGPIRDGIQVNTVWALHELRKASKADVSKARDIITNKYGMPWSNQSRSRLVFSIRSVQNIFDHPWWSRIWVAQEIGLAKRVVALIGARPILWSEVRGAIKTVLECCKLVDWAMTSKGRHLSWETILFRNVQRAAELAKLGPGEGRENKQCLYDLLHNFQSLQASNLRDRVYGLMGLATDYHILDIKPNYSTPLHMVSRVAMKNLLLQTQKLLPLALAVGVEHDTYSGAASWGLKLLHRSQPKSSLAVLRSQFASDHQKWTSQQKLRFRTSKFYGWPAIEFSEDYQQLTIAGYAIDTILVMDSNLKLGAKDQADAQINWLPILKLKQYLPTLSGWIQHSKNADTLIPPFQSPPSPKNVDDLILPFHPPLDIALESYHQSQEMPAKGSKTTDSLIKVFETTLCLGMLSPTCSEKDIQQRIHTTLRSHRIAITARGSVVLVPNNSQPNDMICIFPRGDLPLVLRNVSKRSMREYDSAAFFSAVHSNMRKKSNGNSDLNGIKWGFQALKSLKGNDKDDFHLVGEAYCDGIMFGEAVPYWRMDGLQKFKIF